MKPQVSLVVAAEDSRGVPGSLASPVQSVSLSQPSVGSGSGPEQSGNTQQKGHKASVLF